MIPRLVLALLACCCIALPAAAQECGALPLPACWSSQPGQSLAVTFVGDPVAAGADLQLINFTVTWDGTKVRLSDQFPLPYTPPACGTITGCAIGSGDSMACTWVNNAVRDCGLLPNGLVLLDPLTRIIFDTGSQCDAFEYDLSNAETCDGPTGSWPQFAPCLLDVFPGQAGGKYDSDGDGVDNCFDRCILESDPGQQDTDSDGLGNACDGDFPGASPPGQLNSADFTYFLQHWNMMQSDPGWDSDVNMEWTEGPQVINGPDWTLFGKAWNGTPANFCQWSGLADFCVDPVPTQ